jgi:hypothetical protein
MAGILSIFAKTPLYLRRASPLRGRFLHKHPLDVYVSAGPKSSLVRILHTP